MAEPVIKQDPESQGASPAGFADEDIYEDAGDLEFNQDPNFQKLYLARVPKYIWENWSKLDDDAEIELGTVRQMEVVNPDGSKRVKLMMLLKHDLAQHQMIPKEYELQVTEELVKNTFVFTEQDLPGFKSKSNQKFDPMTANMPSRLNRPKVERPKGVSLFDKSKGFQPYYRRAIPKKTTLAGRVAHEVNCVAIMNEEANRILTQRTLEAMRPKAGTVHMQKNSGVLERQFVQPGTVQAAGAFGGFIKNAGTATSKARAAQELKTARMPQNELLDLIFQCFRQYNFWSMKALRAKLRQPEAYLKETLEKIADMPRSGSFALHWTLKPEFKQTTEGPDPDAGAAPGSQGDLDGADDSDTGDLDGDDDDDDENIKMEDVLPQ